MKKIILFLIFLTSCTITGNIIKEPEPLQAEAYFCQETNCTQLLINYFNNSDNISCAFYDINKNLIKNIDNKNIKLVLDDHSKLNSSFIRKDDKNQLMHNKFCIFDTKTVLTGSFNPTIKSEKDYNDIIIINSSKLALLYQTEFDELWNGIYGDGEKTKNNIIIFDDAIIEVFFCPEDGCAQKLEAELEAAQSSIYFMTYSFTHDSIANLLIIKKSEGIDIKGIYEKSQETKYSKYKLLEYQNITIKPDNSKQLLHHKIFIIDNNTVITGSFNPTYNADKKNDENLIIIKNKGLAEEYLNTFTIFWNK